MKNDDRSGRVLPLEPTADYWEVTCRRRYDGARLLEALARILPAGLTLYLEGTSIAPVVVEYVGERRADDGVEVPRGVLAPMPRTLRMPLTPENVHGLVELMAHLSAPEVADHVHAYRDGTAYLIWFDAWFDSPMYVRNDVGEEALRVLGSEFACTYRPYAP